MEIMVLAPRPVSFGKDIPILLIVLSNDQHVDSQPRDATNSRPTIGMTMTPDHVLNKAVSNVQRVLKLDPIQIATLLNLSTESFVRLETDSTLVLPEEARKVAVDLVRIYQALYRFVGGNEEQIQHWISVGNRAFDDERPRNLLASADGVVRVRDYCEAMVEK